MLLENATSKKQVQEALDDGDNELHQDIARSLKRAVSDWRDNEDGIGHSGFRNDQINVLENEVYGNERFARDVVDESKKSSYSLDQIPLEFIIARLRTLPVNRGRLGPFSLETGESGDFSFHFVQENHHSFEALFLPDNWELIPDSYAAQFWKSFGKIKWDETSKFGHNDGTSEGTDDLYIEARDSDFIELCKDILTAYVSDEEHFDSWSRRCALTSCGAPYGQWVRKSGRLVQASFELLVKKFIEIVSFLHMDEIEEKDLAALDHELLKGFAVQWFTSTSGTQQDIVESLLDAIAAKAGGAVEEPEHVIMELPKEKLAELGITKGVLAEEAPWKLLKLSARQLSTEGASMNHCVGDRGMGYAEAVRKGEIDIWSLRDRTGKPRFTIEVDKSLEWRTSSP